MWHDFFVELGPRLLEHLELVGVSLVLGGIIALPIGRLLADSRYQAAILGALSILYTIPSLAALALLVPVLGLGAGTAIAVLTMYAATILTRAVVLGISSISPQIRECGPAMGFDAWSGWWRIELPLAMPSIMAGIRTAALTLLSTATLAAWVDGGGLGVIFFAGLRQDDMQRILAGSAVLMGLALLMDAGFARLEQYFREAAGI